MTQPDPPNGWFESFNRAASEAVRITMLQMMGVIAAATGLFLVFASPSAGQSVTAAYGDLFGWPWLYGLILTLSGLAQVFGMTRHHPRLVLVSCGVIGLWYIWFGCGFVIAWIMWHTHGELTDREPVVYPMSVYVGLGMLQFAQGLIVRNKMQAEETRRAISDDPRGEV